MSRPSTGVALIETVSPGLALANGNDDVLHRISFRLFFLVNGISLDISSLIEVVDVGLGNQSIQALVRPVTSVCNTTDSPTNNILVAILGGSSYALTSRNGLGSYNATVIVVQEANADLVVSNLRLLVNQLSGNRNGMRSVLSISFQAIKVEGSINNLNISAVNEPALEFLVFRNILQGRQALKLAGSLQLVSCIMVTRLICTFGNDRCIPAVETNVNLLSFLVNQLSGNRNGMRVVLSISLQAIKAEGSSNNLNVSTIDEPALEFLVFRNIFQGRQVLVLAGRVQLVGCIMSIRPRCAFGNDRCIPAAEANADFIRNDVGTAFVCCKRCKRNAHDNHEHGSQQSQQTSFEVRFLHVNFSYSLVFI